MSKRVRILGMEIDNHTIREMMFLLDEYVNSDGLNLAGVVTADLLMTASENPDIRQILEHMDMHIIGDATILEVLEETYEQQVGEVQRRDLEEVFLNSLISKRKKVYWISDSENDMPALQDYMQQNYPKLNIAGSYMGDMNEENIDSIVNEINGVVPDVILFQTDLLSRLKLFIQYRNQLNAKLCICMGYRIKSKYWSPNRNSKIKTLIDQTMFKRKVVRYQMNHKG
ncbi:MAG: WecB/TagA/CpsF family glycosyltransferase [Lachnospiraceae bacterium]|nr:WecB/TagA/CpsF family glycosyltransferase [Lachnospiraceae bacterium]